MTAWTEEPTVPGETLRCAIYTWSSRMAGGIRSGRSAAAQREVCCRCLAEQHGLTVLAQCYDDVIVGSHHRRPALQRLFDDIDRGQIDIVALDRAGRLGGSPVELATVMERLEADGVALLLIDQGPAGATLAGRLTTKILRGLGDFVVAS